MTDDELRRSYARHLRDGALAGREHCASPEALLALVERQGSEDDRLDTLDHAGGCAACRHDLELLRAVHLAGAPRAVRPSPQWRSWATTPRVRLAAAAVLVIAVGAVVTTRGREEIVMRGGASTVTLVSPAGEISASALTAVESITLTWRATPGAERYGVELLGVAGDSLFAAATTDTTLTLPSNVVLLPDRDYLWSVRATLRDGTHATAAPLRFRLRQP